MPADKSRSARKQGKERSMNKAGPIGTPTGPGVKTRRRSRREHTPPPRPMKSARFRAGGCVLAIVLVESADTLPERATALLALLQPHFPTLPIMLVSIEDTGLRAFATFQTSELLAQLRLDELAFVDLEIDASASHADELPF
jgi:hypothetical protein